MRPDLIYFKELLLGENNKFTLDFSDEEFVQKVDFLSKNEYYIIHYKDKKIKKLSEKSRLLLEKGPAYQIDLNYLLLETL